MSTDNGWPDPARPGVPLNPERDGWHWLQFRGRSAPYHWTTAQAPRNGVWHIPPDWEVMPEDRAITNQRYFGPCLTLADVAAREAAAAEAMRAERDAAKAEADRRTKEVELTYLVQRRLTAERDAARADAKSLLNVLHWIIANRFMHPRILQAQIDKAVAIVAEVSPHD